MTVGTKKIFAILFLVILGVSVYRIVEKKQSEQKRDENIEVPVEIIKVKRMSIADKIKLTGDIRGYYEAKVFPKVTGKINRRIKAVGEKVSKDETILTIDRDEPALEFSLAEVKSPFDGIITRYFLNEGETVSPLAPVAEVASIQKIKVVVQVPERYVPKVSTGRGALFYVDSFPKAVFTGTISNISQVLDSITRTANIEIIAENPKGLLKPGMFARVEIISESRTDAIAIPKKAAIFNPEGEINVFVVKDNIAYKRNITAGLQTADLIEVLSGIKEGELVVVLGQYRLNDGVKVNICSEGVYP